MKTIFFSMLILLVLDSHTILQETQLKPRIVVLTDIFTWESDDHESLIRLHVHADMFEIEGETVVDYVEPENPVRAPHRKQRLIDPNGGAITLQAHDAFSTWYFKEIKIKKLPD